ncbi:MAG TPA: TerB family tellurite resistance protein [Amaricoccus sp.]|uniref:tellurite resistance TerB family protein n=1 Tax=Amaricoccus sp. TaxID=1872485 RepID=UPI002BDCD52C|nr:TerB family tellurite resistance protein [Amaricoccus sp.]HMQ93678.1 TerB family tellurite resistance protein [Amaricoccus sp.]HMR52311.1 TerB family tellurite resistance protein [Amaricoccus sp.]HMR61031.1 TerB family tellurite resistance protein [Amaricoccus sp.]HMT99232.1 TerB family tellurite resistance protein [Amaricoccus sp.]
MLTDLLRRLAGEPSPQPLHPDDARLAMAALMVRVARTDGNYTENERNRIDRVLAVTYGLDAGAAAALRGEAEAAEAEAPDTVRFTRLVKSAVPYEHREDVVEALWRVAAADGINADEHGFLRLVANLVGVSDLDSGLARQRALKDRE